MRLPRLLALAALALAPVSIAPAMAGDVYVASRTINPGTPVPTGGAGVALACSTSGTVRLVMANGSTLDLYAQQGTAIIDNMQIVDVQAAATNATCTVNVLYGAIASR